MEAFGNAGDGSDASGTETMSQTEHKTVNADAISSAASDSDSDDSSSGEDSDVAAAVTVEQPQAAKMPVGRALARWASNSLTQGMASVRTPPAQNKSTVISILVCEMPGCENKSEDCIYFHEFSLS